MLTVLIPHQRENGRSTQFHQHETILNEEILLMREVYMQVILEFNMYLCTSYVDAIMDLCFVDKNTLNI